MNELLNGSNPTADARLLADIDAADPFDGGCAADCEPRRVPPATSFAQKLDALQRESEAAGVRAAILWLRNNRCAWSELLESAHARGEVLK